MSASGTVGPGESLDSRFAIGFQRRHSRVRPSIGRTLLHNAGFYVVVRSTGRYFGPGKRCVVTTLLPDTEIERPKRDAGRTDAARRPARALLRAFRRQARL